MKRFLALPFAKGTSVEIEEGWLYSEQEQDIHGRKVHGALDFKLSVGTAIYAPADGLALAMYQFRHIKSETGRWIGFGLGLFVHIYHKEGGVYFTLAHLSESNVPTVPTTKLNRGWYDPQAIYLPLGQLHLSFPN